MIDIINRLKDLLNGNQSDRLIKEKFQQNRIVDTNLLRHTVYKGDRIIQQLGQEPIENGVILSNQSLEIDDVMLPLAKGNVLRRVDNTNGGALLGTAYRDALENDYDANGKRRSSKLSRNGGNEPSNPNNPNKPKPKPDRVPPPFGCTPPPPKCFWSRSPIAPRGFQSHGSAVVNENGIPVYLHCASGVNAPSNLNCSFLDLQKWACLGGVCVPSDNGIYTSQSQCESARSVYWNVFVQGIAVTGFGVVIPVYKEGRGTTTNTASVTLTQGVIAGTFDGVTYYQYAANGNVTTSGFRPTPSLVFEIVATCPI